ncbi:MAG: MATE family efflux transporter, partial [Bacillota bacterium]|nr:MATE family efflux transporter [Bacillota bacterium]
MNSLSIRNNKEFYLTLITISLPIMLQNLITSSFSIVDNIMIGNLGTDYIAATGMANQIVFLLVLLSFGTCSGTSIFIAQFWGKQEIQQIKHVVALGFRITGIIASAFFVASFFAPRAIMSLLTPDPNVVELGTVYLRIIAPTFLGYAVGFPITFASRSVGKPKIAMYGSILSILINTVLNYGLIFGHFGLPRLGIVGAAYATLISKAVELFLLLYWTKRHIPFVLFGWNELRKIPKELTRDVMRRALPVLLNEGFWSLGMTAISVIISWSSTEAVAAYFVANVVMSLFQVLSFGIGNASATMLGNQLGAGERERALDYNKKLLAINTLSGVVTAVAIFASAGWIVHTFYNMEPEAAKAAVYTLWVIAIALPLKFYNTVMII